MNPDNLTKILAVWGAVTGTIGTVTGIITLLLRLKSHKKDQPKLICTSDFSFEHFNDDVKEKHKIIIRSVGKSPVTVDFIRFCIEPPTFWYRLIKKSLWAKKRWVYDPKPRDAICLTEGKKSDFPIKFPKGIKYTNINRVEVHDQAGKVWKVAWPNKSQIAILTRHEQLCEKEIKENDRFCKVVGYAAGKTYHISVSWRSKQMLSTQTKRKVFNFKNKKQCFKKFESIINELAPQIVSGEIEEIT